MKNLKSLIFAVLITFSLFASVAYFAPVKIVANKEYKLIFGSLVKI